MFVGWLNAPPPDSCGLTRWGLGGTRFGRAAAAFARCSSTITSCILVTAVASFVVNSLLP